MLYISNHHSLYIECSWKRKGIKGRSRLEISKDNHGVSKHPCLFLHTACLSSIKGNCICLFFFKLQRKTMTPIREFLYFQFCVPFLLCYCNMPFWGLGDGYGQFSYLTPPHLFWEWLWKPARLHCYPSVNYKCARHPKHWGGSAVIRKSPRGYGQCHLWLARWPLEHQMCKRGMINCSLD